MRREVKYVLMFILVLGLLSMSFYVGYRVGIMRAKEVVPGQLKNIMGLSLKGMKRGTEYIKCLACEHTAMLDMLEKDRNTSLMNYSKRIYSACPMKDDTEIMKYEYLELKKNMDELLELEKKGYITFLE